ncbi:MAG: metallophosphoesterase family protein [Candidatus Caldatribacteriaceae bacterium]
MKPKIKVLHTADWHIGLVSWKTQREVDRLEEQKECLQEMLVIAEKEKVDLIIHSGDLFHHSYHPPREAIQLAVDTLLAFSQLAPFVWVIGNHDWYAVEALRSFFPEQVMVIKDFEVRRLPELQVSIFPFPYLSLAKFLGSDMSHNIQGLVQEKVHGLWEEWRKKWHPSFWNVLVAHATVEDLALHYLEANADREVFLKRGDLPSFFHYGAFGHLHGLIPLDDPFPIWYPSSLVCDSFKQVEGRGGGFVIVELEEGEIAKVTPYFFKSSHLLSLDLEERLTKEHISKIISERIKAKRSYIRLRVREEIVESEWYRSLRELRGENWEVVVVEVIPRDGSISKEEKSSEEGTIPELFSRFCEENHFPDEVVGLFLSYYQEVVEEKTAE